MTTFVEVADGVHVLRHPILDVNVTLVVGAGSALLVDALSHPRQGREALAAARRITALELSVVYTHHHFDHCFGASALDPVAVYAHPDAADALAACDPARVARDHPEVGDLSAVVPRRPDHRVRDRHELDLGGRVAVLRFLGRGHTAGDLVVHVPDAGVVVAGDLVEESGPPDFEDAFPLEWPATLAALLDLDPRTVVPGHGAPCDAGFVREQHADLAALEWLIRDGDAADATVESVAAKAGYPVATARIAVARGYAELAGRAE